MSNCSCLDGSDRSPLIVFQPREGNRWLIFWHSKAAIPEPVGIAIEETLKRHGDYRVIIADDDYVKAHIAARYSTEILALYESNQVPASRSDMARLMLLYAFGGFYVDAAMGFQQPLH